MSKGEIESILYQFDGSEYFDYLMSKYNLSPWKEKWSHSIILQKLKEAFSNGICRHSFYSFRI